MKQKNQSRDDVPRTYYYIQFNTVVGLEVLSHFKVLKTSTLQTKIPNFPHLEIVYLKSISFNQSVSPTTKSLPVNHEMQMARVDRWLDSSFLP